MTRLSHYLRTSCANLSTRPSREYDCDGESFVEMQRHKCLQRLQHYDLPDWRSFSNTLYDLADSCNGNNVTRKEIQDRLRDLTSIASQMLSGGNQPIHMIEAAASFLLHVMYEAIFVTHVTGTADLRDTLTSLFDPVTVSADLITRAHDQCKYLLHLIQDQDDFRFLFRSNHHQHHQSIITSPSHNVSDNDRFNDADRSGGGGNVLVEFGVDLCHDLDIFQTNLLDTDFLSWNMDPEQEVKKESKISLDYASYSRAVTGDQDSDSFSCSDDDDDEDSSYDTTWLHNSLLASDVHSIFGMSLEEMLQLLGTHICDAGRSDQELEEELISLLGDGEIPLIRDIVIHRQTLTRSFEHLLKDSQSEPNRPDPHPSVNYKSILFPKRNTRGQSIIVQTEEEKRLLKEARKFEKKLSKDMKRENKDGRLTQSDIDRMRRARKSQLMQAMAKPLFSQGKVEAEPVYEYVFDAFKETKNTAAFIAGHKMILPAGFRRSDDRKMEEMSIPAPAKPPAEMISRFKLIKIKDLDQVAQIGFAGVEQLNQVQSIVYDAAYNSNENLLVCAPTGAGKTNIAMLTILHQVKCNLNPDGSLKLNDFKIVYIAPMKALVAEMVDKFSKSLKPFGILVKELTGDMQMTKAEIAKTQMIVTTPEKWDVITRKTTGVQLLQLVKLTIIDEVHLLESDRGPVLEALVARIIRHVESVQRMSRLVGLSATLPNYVDVAEFLGVSLNKGMFMFDSRFRPVPLELSFVGIKATQSGQQNMDMDEVLYDKVKGLVSQGHQVMVFVHTRNGTYKTATQLIKESGFRGEGKVFLVDDFSAEVSKATRFARNKMLTELIPQGFAIHHAGLLRQDRNLVERLFRDGGIKVLCCTSTLAWGVNLPAHAVVIRGTEMYDPSHGTHVDISMLDVMQIFGRAGRPQYDSSGYACIITSHDKLPHYLSMLTNQFPIESNFMKFITDNLNAEIVAGTVTDVTEGMYWLGYTYLFVRMKKNPLAYGLSYDDLRKDPTLQDKKQKLIVDSALELAQAKMIEFDEESQRFTATDLGKTASFYYIKYDTIVTFNELIRPDMMEDKLMRMLCQAQEFDQLKTREDEVDELLFLQRSCCKLNVPDTVDNRTGKVNILLQSFLSRARMDSFSLSSDVNFVQQNIVRLVRGVFEYSRKSGWAMLAHKTLLLSKMLDRRMWNFESPFHQFNKREIDDESMKRLDQNQSLTVERIKYELDDDEVGRLIRNHAKGKVVRQLSHLFPMLVMNPVITVIQEMPDASVIVTVSVHLVPDFTWSDNYHGKLQAFWFWLYDDHDFLIYHSDYVIFAKANVDQKMEHEVSCTIRLKERFEYVMLHIDSDYWLGCESDLQVTVDYGNFSTSSSTIPDSSTNQPIPSSMTVLSKDCSSRGRNQQPSQKQARPQQQHRNQNNNNNENGGNGAKNSNVSNNANNSSSSNNNNRQRRRKATGSREHPNQK